MCHVSCQLAHNARTCDDRHAAAPTDSSTMKWETPKSSMQRFLGSALQGEQPLSPEEQPARVSAKASYLPRVREEVSKKKKTQQVAMCVLREPVTTPTQSVLMVSWIALPSIPAASARITTKSAKKNA